MSGENLTMSGTGLQRPRPAHPEALEWRAEHPRCVVGELVRRSWFESLTMSGTAAAGHTSPSGSPHPQQTKRTGTTFAAPVRASFWPRDCYLMWIPEIARAITRRWISDVPS